MRNIVLICDRCKKSETLASDKVNDSVLNLLPVGVAVCDPNITSYGYNTPQAFMKTRQDWCLECRTEIGLVFKTAEQEKAKPSPILEEQLVEVLRCFVESNTPQQK